MANFKEHLLYGIGVSAAGAATAYGQFGLGEIQAGAAFVLGTLASLAPDLDHCEGTPGKISCEALAALFPILVVLNMPVAALAGLRLEHWILYATLGYVAIRFSLRFLLRHLTTHRGIFHSIPAAVICGEAVYLALGHLALEGRWVVAGVAALGYLTHLIADAVYAVDWSGRKIKAKRSFGRAVNLGRWGELSTWVAWAVAAGLGWVIYNQGEVWAWWVQVRG